MQQESNDAFLKRDLDVTLSMDFLEGGGSRSTLPPTALGGEKSKILLQCM